MEALTYNIQYCLGRDDRFDVGRIIDTVRDADVIALQEVERYWTRSDNMDQARVIADALPRHYWMFGPTIDVLKDDAPMVDGRVDNRRRQFGNMVLSRYPILSARNHLLPKYTDPEKFTIQRGVLEATVASPLGPIRVMSTHLCHLSQDQRLLQVEAIRAIHGRAETDGAVYSGQTPEAWGEERIEPVTPPRRAIVMGDFNMEPGSPEYERMLAPHTDAESSVSAARFVDGWLQAGGDPEAGATLYADFACRTGKRIDYCFVSEDLTDRLRTVRVDTDADGSDHQPVRATLVAD